MRLTSFRSSSLVLFHLPNWRKIDLALCATERLLWLRRCLLVLRQIIDDVLETEQIDELAVAGVRDEVHLWRWRLWWWNLKKSLLELLA